MNCGISWKWKTRKSGSRSNYTFLLSHASGLKTTEYIMELRGQCKDVSDVSLLVETLYSCFLSLNKLFCGRDYLGPIFHLCFLLLSSMKWNLWKLNYNFLKREECFQVIISPSFPWCLCEHLPLPTHIGTGNFEPEETAVLW